MAEGRSYDDLYRQFTRILNQPGGVPPILDGECIGIPFGILEHILVSLLAMVSRVMVTGPIESSHVDDAKRHIKIFLTCYERFDILRRGRTNETAGMRRSEKNTARWISNYNFVSLLNLPGTLQRYGSLRMLCEGDGKAEAGIQPLKKRINGLIGNWAHNAASSYQKERALQRVLTSLRRTMETTDHSEDGESVEAMIDVIKRIVVQNDGEADDGEDNDDDELEDQGDGRSRANSNSNSRYKNYCTYENVQESTRLVNEGMVVSGVVMNDGTYGIVIDGGDILQLRPEGQSRALCGAKYFKWITLGTTRYSASQVSSYFLLLPRLTSSGFQKPQEFDGYFYMMTSDWKEMDENYELVRPRMMGAHYT